MFILGEVYDFYAKNHLLKDENIVNKFEMTKFVLLDNGFETKDLKIFSKKVNNVDLIIDFESVYNITFNEECIHDMKDFMNVYKKFTKEDFDVSKYNGLDSYDWKKLELNTSISNLEIYCKTFLKYVIDEVDMVDWSNKESIREFIKKNYYDIVFYKESIIPDISKIREYKEIENIYLLPLLMGELLNEYTEFKRLHIAMCLTNIVYKPSFGGTQCGCREAEEKYSYIVNKIVKGRLDKLKEEEDDVEEINPMNGFNDKIY